MTLPLKEIEALLETATRGEWGEGFRNVEERSGSCIFSEDGDIIADCDCGLDCFEENAALISALRNHAPTLLAAAKREEAMREALEKIALKDQIKRRCMIDNRYEYEPGPFADIARQALSGEDQ